MSVDYILEYRAQARDVHGVRPALLVSPQHLRTLEQSLLIMGGGGTGDAARKLLTVEDYVCINDCEVISSSWLSNVTTAA